MEGSVTENKEAVIVFTNSQVRNSKYIFKDLEHKTEKPKLNSHPDVRHNYT